jgi:hypothetical protein
MAFPSIPFSLNQNVRLDEKYSFYFAIPFIYQIALEYHFTLFTALLHPPPFLDLEPYTRRQSYKSFPSSSART